MALFIQSFINSLVLSVTLSLIALGVSLLFGILLLVNLAHGELYMVGAFVFWLFFQGLGVHPVFAVVASVVIVALLAAVVERIAFRPIRGQMIQGFITSMGVILILQTAALLVFGPTDKATPSFPGFGGLIKMGSISFAADRVLVLIVGTVFILALNGFLRFNRWGKALQAIAQDPEAAALQGIPINRASTLAMMIGGALAALAGSILAPISYVNPYIGQFPILKALAAVVIGGIGSLPGTIAACFILGFIEGYGSTYLGGPIAFMIIFSFLVLFILIRPHGLMGREVVH